MPDNFRGFKPFARRGFVPGPAMIVSADDRVQCKACNRAMIVHQYEGAGDRWWREPCDGHTPHKLTPRVLCPHGHLRETCIKCVHAPARI